MAFRFRKSIKVAPGLRMNISTKGVSTSIGPRGATVNIGKRGTRVTTSIPGTGISFSKKLSGPRQAHDVTEAPQDYAGAFRVLLLWGALTALIAIFIGRFLTDWIGTVSAGLAGAVLLLAHHIESRRRTTKDPDQ